VDAIQGICGPPQSDASLSEARRIVGPEVALWGGIPQDAVLDTYRSAQFEAAVAQALEESAGDKRIILGVADRVPADADMERLRAIPELVEQQSSNLA
jgi:uroporphyrinogen-III decarboxylase